MRQKELLLADDDGDDKEMFCEALAAIDDTVICHHVENGREVFQKLSELTDSPDLIFLDINMPVMTGWECLKRLKEHQRYKDIPVVIYTTSSHQQEIDIAVDLGALCFISKPTDFDDLKDVLRFIVANLGENLQQAMIEFCKKSKHILSCTERRLHS